MFQNFPDYVPEQTCLSCQGCCRFDAVNSLWRPKISEEEIEDIHQTVDVGRKIYTSGTVDQEHSLKTSDIPKSHQSTAYCKCAFFDIEKNKCKVYKQRPFDCRLYPFLLIKKSGAYFVGVHLNCPFIEKTRRQQMFKDHAEKLKGFFAQPDVLEYFKRHKFLAGEFAEYQHEIDCLFKLEIA